MSNYICLYSLKMGLLHSWEPTYYFFVNYVFMFILLGICLVFVYMVSVELMYVKGSL